jgi:hypothetical protein
MSSGLICFTKRGALLYVCSCGNVGIAILHSLGMSLLLLPSARPVVFDFMADTVSASLSVPTASSSSSGIVAFYSVNPKCNVGQSKCLSSEFDQP